MLDTFEIVISVMVAILFVIVFYKSSQNEREKAKFEEMQKKQIDLYNEKIKKQFEEIQLRDQEIKIKINKIEKQSNNIQELWRYSSLQQNLNNQIILYSERKIWLLENKYDRIVNSYKNLYFRKMSNLILEAFINKNKDSLSKTENIFLNKEKPNEKQIKFSIIVVSKGIDNIKGIERNLINLIIDFLMYIKDVSSSIIHISKKNYHFQIEILSQYLGKQITKNEEDDKYYINSLDLINILFDNSEKSNEQKNNNIILNKEKNAQILEEVKEKKKFEIKKKVFNDDKKKLLI